MKSFEFLRHNLSLRTSIRIQGDYIVHVVLGLGHDDPGTFVLTLLQSFGEGHLRRVPLVVLPCFGRAYRVAVGNGASFELDIVTWHCIHSTPKTRFLEYNPTQSLSYIYFDPTVAAVPGL